MPTQTAEQPNSEKPKGYETAEVDSLHLDSRNPRLIQYGLAADASEPDVLRVLIDQMDVEEVAMSIAASGYWDHEPLFVVKEKGKDVVIEGNRRLAAVKLLRNPIVRAHEFTVNLIV